MATRKGYELKRGYLAQFQDAYKGVKSFTNDQLTDDLAEEYLRRYPSRVIYFSQIPVFNNPSTLSEIKIIPPLKKENKEQIVDEMDSIADNLIAGIAGESKESKKPVKRTLKTKK